jgi:DHA1 family bicyclomycin/chloramphenicol resistance-like MFS transporter
VAYLASLSASGGILFAYIGASSFVLQGRFALSPTAYGFVFALNAAGIFTLANVTRHVVARTGPLRLLVIGQVQALVGVGILALGMWWGVLPVVVLGMFVAISSNGLVVGNSLALGMQQAGERAGSASGLLGIFQFTVGSICAVLAGLGGSPWAMVVVMLVAAVLGPVIRLLLMSDEKGVHA